MKRFYSIFLVMLVLGTALASAAPEIAPRAKRTHRQAVDIRESLSGISRAGEGEEEGEEWKSLGLGSMTDDMVTYLYNFKPVTWEVEIFQNSANPALYRIYGPYGENFAAAMYTQNGVLLKQEEYDFEGSKVFDIDATDPKDVIFHKTMIGCDWGSGEMYIGIPTSGHVTFSDGIFSAPIRGVAIGDDDGAVAANTRGKFRICLPEAVGTDFTLEITPESHCVTSRDVKVNVKIGEDIAAIKYGVVPEMQEDEMKSYYNEVIKSGGAYAMEPEFAYTMDDVRKETIIMVGFNYNNEPVAYDWATYYFIDDDPDSWVALGKAKYTDDLPGVCFANMEPTTYEVDIEEHKDRPGYYRLVNPYDGKYPYNTKPERYHSGHNHYLYINAEDPTFVYIEESILGCNWGYGEMRASSTVQYYFDAGFELEEIMELEEHGTLEEGVITFPAETLLFSMLDYEDADWLISNASGEACVVLPAKDAADSIITDNDDAPEVYYNLQGVRVDRPTSGIYVVRKGNTARKIIVK